MTSDMLCISSIANASSIASSPTGPWVARWHANSVSGRKCFGVPANAHSSGSLHLVVDALQPARQPLAQPGDLTRRPELGDHAVGRGHALTR